MTKIVSIPFEVLEYIVSFLPYKDFIFQFRRVNRCWYLLTKSNNTIWKQKCKQLLKTDILNHPLSPYGIMKAKVGRMDGDGNDGYNIFHRRKLIQWNKTTGDYKKYVQNIEQQWHD